MIFADERANGIPPPGCTLPPQKIKIFILKKSFCDGKMQQTDCLKYRTRNPYKNMFYLVSVVVLVALQTG
jgi:hypothetical protein